MNTAATVPRCALAFTTRSPSATLLRSFGRLAPWLSDASAAALRCAVRHRGAQLLPAPAPCAGSGWGPWLAWRARPLPLRTLALGAAPRPSPRLLSQRATWSLTAFAALVRLGIVVSENATSAAASAADADDAVDDDARPPPLVLALLGAGEREGTTAEATIGVFWQLLELLARAGIRDVVLLCVGKESVYPEDETPRSFALDFTDAAAARVFVGAADAAEAPEAAEGGAHGAAAAATATTAGDDGGDDGDAAVLATAAAAAAAASRVAAGDGLFAQCYSGRRRGEASLLRVVVQHVYGLLHEVASTPTAPQRPALAGIGGSSARVPDLALCYHGGVWGYSSWRDTLAPLGEAGCPIVVTSYNLYEAEDDWDVLHAWGLRHLWEEEPNPFRSLVALQRPSVPERMAWNWYWQCVV